MVDGVGRADDRVANKIFNSSSCGLSRKLKSFVRNVVFAR
jgi:hypothetical protein